MDEKPKARLGAVPTMDERRKGEIAIAVLKFKLGKAGMNFDNSSRRNLGNMAKATGVPFDEMKLFARVITFELMDEFLS